jgi:plasmid stability protein
MTNLTITVDEDVLKKARIRALEQGTSVNQVLREYLRAYAGAGAVNEAVERALAVADRASSGSGRAGRTWTREDLYNRYGR